MANGTVFITGFPGFIAGRLIKRLAMDGAKFFLLVQPALLSRARAEISQIAEETGADAGNFRIIAGDITKKDLDMSFDELSSVRAETTTVFHLAAIYDLAVRHEIAQRVNVEGTRNVNGFARTIAHLRRYHYVSTCYVAGKRQGVIYENELEHTA